MNPTRRAMPSAALVLVLGVCGCSSSTSASAGTGTGTAAGHGSTPATPVPAASAQPAASTTSPAATFGPPAPAGSSTAAHPSAHPGGGVPPGILQGNLGVRDQQGDGRSVALSAEIDGSPGWVVIARDERGRPGRTIGSVLRGNGVHDDVVTVALKPRLSVTTTLWATLVVDQGRPGVLEYPGADSPLQFQGRDLSRPFTYTVS